MSDPLGHRPSAFVNSVAEMRRLLRDANIVICRDKRTSHEFIVYGLELLRAIADGEALEQRPAALSPVSQRPMFERRTK